MKKNRFRHQVVTDPQDVGRYLEALIEGFQSGQLSFSSANDRLLLKPAEIMEMTIESCRRHGQVKLNLNFTWAEPDTKKASLPFEA